MRFVAFSFPCSSLLRSLSSFFSLNFLFTISFAFALAILHGGDTNAKCHCHTLFIHFPEPRTNTQLFYIYFFPLFCMAANDRLTHSFPPPPSRPYDFSSKRLRNFNYTCILPGDPIFSWPFLFADGVHGSAFRSRVFEIHSDSI